MPHRELIIDGVFYPSVTTVLGGKPKPWLLKWQQKWGKLADRKTAAANVIGTEFHRCVEELINVLKFETSNRRVRTMMTTFVDWADKVNVDVLATETQVISHEHTYSGTLDAIGVWNGELCVFDWKTSSGIYDDMSLQLVAYARAYEEKFGHKVTKGVIVHVSKDKPHHKLTIAEYQMTDRLFDRFLKRLSDYNAARLAA